MIRCSSGGLSSMAARIAICFQDIGAGVRSGANRCMTPLSVLEHLLEAQPTAEVSLRAGFRSWTRSCRRSVPDAKPLERLTDSELKKMAVGDIDQESIAVPRFGQAEPHRAMLSWRFNHRVNWAGRNSLAPGTWPARILARMPRMRLCSPQKMARANLGP